MALPAGAVGLVRPRGLIGRIIAKRCGVPFSHAIMALGNGKVTDSTWKWVHFTPESKWAKDTVWWIPRRPYSGEEARVVKSAAHMADGRIKYWITALFDFLFKGTPGHRGNGLFCTYYVAELSLIARDFDFSGMQKITGKPEPWKVDPRTMLMVLENSGEYTRVR